MSTTRTRLEIAAGVVILILGALYVREQWNKSLDAREAQAFAKAKAEAQKDIDQILKRYDAEQKSRDAQHEKATEFIQKADPQQIVVKLPEYVPQATKPIVIVGPQPSTVDLKPGDAVVPEADIKPIAQALLDGKKCSADLAACGERVEQWQKKYALKDAESDSWEKAAKGGSTWTRVKRCVLARGAVGAVTGASVGKDKVQGLEIGGAIGVGSCLLWR